MARHPKAPLSSATVPLTHMLPPGALDLVEWDLILQTGSNALLQGPPPALTKALSALEPHLPAPHCTALGPRWSQPSAEIGTLFLEHVDECSIEQQHLLLDWLDRAAQSVQVITTTERPLFDLVERGAFLSSLYYRLNTIHLRLDPAF
jgi:Sigma-54 interaction domain